MSLDFDAEDLSEDLVLSNTEFFTDKVDVLKILDPYDAIGKGHFRSCKGGAISI